MQLCDLVDALGRVAATRSRTAKRAALAETLSALSPQETPAAVGLVLGRPRQGRVGIGWRTIVAVRDEVAADAPSDAEGEPAPATPLTVADVDDALEHIAGSRGAGSAAARRSALADLLGRATEAERDLLTRVLLGEVRTGALEGVLLDALAEVSGQPAAVVRRAAMLSGDIGHVAQLALTDPLSLTEIGLSALTPVSPMLASPGADVASALEKLGTASVEHKLDGARIQVHRDGDEVRVFTRTLAEVTERVPEIVEAVRRMPCRSVILDGETLLLDDDGRPRPFQETMSRFGAHASEVALRPWFFDVLHLDGRDLIDEPLSTRREVLVGLAPELVIPGIITADPVAAETFAQGALEVGHEGVVLKSLEAPYAAGRRGAAWVKVKPVHTLDLVVLAVEWGSGRRSGWLSNIHLGARDAEGALGEPGDFVMVGKTFKGMTDEILRWQTEHFPTIETRRTRSTVFVRPETVVEVAIDGVQRSERYPGGVALRFARVKGYRPDKTPDEADTIGTLREMLRS